MFLFCLCTVSKLNLFLLDCFDEFVIKYLLIIFDDFEEKGRNSICWQRDLNKVSTVFKLLR